MSDVRVTCVDRTSVNGSHEGITHLGGSQWYWTRAQVIQSIEAGTNTFYTYEGNKRAEVAVVNGPSGKYLRTHRDGAWTDNLLALNACPIR